MSTRGTVDIAISEIKTMKQYIGKLGVIRRIGLTLGVVALAVVFIGGGSFSAVHATSIQDQIDALNAQNAVNNAKVDALEDQAVSYEDAIARLNSQIGLLRGAIAANQAKQADLKAKIAAAQAELEHQKQVLSELLKAMYVNGQMSTFEMLATSKDLSTFVDAETYRNAVQNKIQQTLAEITALQRKLAEQKTQVEGLLAKQRVQEADLSNKKAKQDNLLAYNQNQRASYNAKTRKNRAKINDLIAEQARLNSSDVSASYYFLRFPGSVADHNWSADNYPYRNGGFGMSTAPGCVDNDGPDPWGYCTRQCVSYAAWAVKNSGRNPPMYYGNARSWVVAARNAGVPVYTSNPQPGDVAISTRGTWGHAMYVEKVSGNQIFVSQYNSNLTGQYSTKWRTFE